ncbi:50S ribosomal protein L5 [Candidatus Campbellbacteria bacterium]|nr:MAG: 50S ribosomal protein L5 [Candidatus Campbellbacteria bacterium]
MNNQGVKEKINTGFEILKDKISIKNKMQSPKLEKVTISVGVGKFRDDKRKLEVVQDRLEKITGQKPVVAAAKKSIATYKVREGDVSGYKVTLRGEQMYSFVDKLINISLPRTKDFRGISKKSVDQMGNLTIGVKEHIVFAETPDEEIKDIFGLSVTLTSTAESKEDAITFFEYIGIPFKKEETK